MRIHIKDVLTYRFSFEINQAVATDKYYSWEVRTYGRASEAAKALRHYWLEKLLTKQLREFDRD